MAESFVRYQPHSRSFLIQQLRHSDPYLAAYAFKCLIRSQPLSLADIPADVIERREEINSVQFGCMGDQLPVGKYITEYFDSQQYRSDAK